MLLAFILHLVMFWDINFYTESRLWSHLLSLFVYLRIRRLPSVHMLLLFYGFWNEYSIYICFGLFQLCGPLIIIYYHWYTKVHFCWKRSLIHMIKKALIRFWRLLKHDFMSRVKQKFQAILTGGRWVILNFSAQICYKLWVHGVLKQG